MKPQSYTKTASQDELSETPPDRRSDDSQESDTVIFLGKPMSQDEYEMACHNLREYFDLLKSWREGESDESADL